MELQENRIAIISPSKNAYSETFIQVQKKGLKGQVFYYYGDVLPEFLENNPPLSTKYERLYFKMKNKIGLTQFSVQELPFIKSLRQHNIQVILAQYGTTAHRILKICIYLNIPLVTHFHGFDASVSKVVKRCNYYKEVFAYSSKVIAVSKRMKDMLLDMGCPKEKLVYNPCVSRSEFIKIKPAFSKNKFVAIGRFTNKKAPYYTLLAFKNILKEHPNAELVMAGDGELINVCKNLTKYFNLSEQVTFLGVISLEEIQDLFQESLAFVQHSITAENGDMEGTPVAIVEASAAGLPVISTNHAGIPDVIIHGKTGLLCEEHDIDAMSSYMKQVLDDVSYAKKLGDAGKKNIIENFNIEKHLNILEVTLKETIQQ